MRIIRITSCFDCDPWKGSGVYCGKDGDISIHYHVYHKTLHEDCPLDEAPPSLIPKESGGGKDNTVGLALGWLRKHTIYEELDDSPDVLLSSESNRGEVDKIETKYHELLYAVGQKYPGESRHETALRYIKEAELGETPKAGFGSAFDGTLKTSMDGFPKYDGSVK